MKPRIVGVLRDEGGLPVQVRLAARTKKGCGQRKSRRDREGRKMHQLLATVLREAPGAEVHYTHRYDDGSVEYAGRWMKSRRA